MGNPVDMVIGNVYIMAFKQLFSIYIPFFSPLHSRQHYSSIDLFHTEINVFLLYDDYCWVGESQKGGQVIILDVHLIILDMATLLF